MRGSNNASKIRRSLCFTQNLINGSHKVLGPSLERSKSDNISTSITNNENLKIDTFNISNTLLSSPPYLEKNCELCMPKGTYFVFIFNRDDGIICPNNCNKYSFVFIFNRNDGTIFRIGVMGVHIFIKNYLIFFCFFIIF